MSSLPRDSQSLKAPLVAGPPGTAGGQSRIPVNAHLAILLVVLFLALATAIECQSITHLPSLVYGAVLWGWWGIVASGTWKLREGSSRLSTFSPLTLSLHLVVACVLGIVHLLLLWALGFTAVGWAPGETPQMAWSAFFSWNRFGLELLLYGFVLGIIGVVQYEVRAQRSALEAAELREQLSAAHLRVLQMQLEPHFLFNTLNAITTLVELGRQEQAAEMLRHLNAILKSTLQRSIPEKVPLAQELGIVESYLAIEQVRFADRLRIELQVARDALEGLVPCFLLQPIVENAIRHGIARCEEEGLIQASAMREGEYLSVRVRNTGPISRGIRPDGTGIGLNNTRERLTHFYRDNFRMKAQPLALGGFEVAITIPYERNG